MFWFFRSCNNPNPDPNQNDKGKQQQETPIKNDGGKPKPQKKKSFSEEVGKYENTHSRKPLAMGMFLLTNIDNSEILLVNKNAEKIVPLVDSAGNCRIKFGDSTLSKRKVEKENFKIFNFKMDSISKDTLAEIEWIIEKETNKSRARTLEFKINTMGGIHLSDPKQK